ncbi:MAG: YggS family pyridoxal phosphate-dependent enzyme [Bacteroidetes bacterium]|nr:MAG: YggS family pyridoxal phosphate-dependent enzyme [Bacteroidota bacterium]
MGLDFLAAFKYENIKLVTVSKTKPVRDIQEVYDTGHKIFGENRTKELQEKYGQLPKDIEWHFIGNLQSKQVKYISSFVHLIHSVDSLKILQVINKEAIKHNRNINCLLQLYIAQEQTKQGFTISELEAVLLSEEFNLLKNINIVGVMGMATFTVNKDQIRGEFRNLKECFDKTKINHFENKEDFKEISMGMSNDYQIAIEEGSTIVRIGSLIFGPR